MRVDTSDSRRKVVDLVRAGSNWLSPACVDAWSTVSGDQWSGILATAQREGMTGLLYASAQKTGHWNSLPECARDPLREAYISNSVTTWRCKHDLVELTRLFERAQIPMLVMKGVGLVESIYKDAGVRPYGDLDLLIPQEFSIRASHMLESLGYIRTLNMLDTGVLFDPHLVNEIAFIHRSGKKESIDLHWSVLLMPYYRDRDDSEWYWHHTHEIDGGSCLFHTLSPEAHFVVLCAHVVKHHFARLIWSHDLAVLITTHGAQMDWAMVCAAVAEFGLTEAVRASLRQVALIWGTPSPQVLLTELDKTRPARGERVNYFAMTSTIPYLRVLVCALTIPGLLNKFHFFTRVFFPAGAYVASIGQNDSTRSLLIYYARRFARSVTKLIHSSI